MTRGNTCTNCITSIDKMASGEIDLDSEMSSLRLAEEEPNVNPDPAEEEPNPDLAEEEPNPDPAADPEVASESDSDLSNRLGRELVHEMLLPGGWEWHARSAVGGPIKYSSKQEAWTRLTNGILLADGAQAYWLDEATSRGVWAVSARAVTIDVDGEADPGCSWSWQLSDSCAAGRSRFPEVAYFEKAQQFKISGTLKLHLPPDSYTVFARVALAHDAAGWDVQDKSLVTARIELKERFMFRSRPRSETTKYLREPKRESSRSAQGEDEEDAAVDAAGESDDTGPGVFSLRGSHHYLDEYEQIVRWSELEMGQFEVNASYLQQDDGQPLEFVCSLSSQRPSWTYIEETGVIEYQRLPWKSGLFFDCFVIRPTFVIRPAPYDTLSYKEAPIYIQDEE